MSGWKVQCPNCKRTDFVTTERYDPNVTPNGGMVKCLLPYQIDWLTASTTLASEMTCPECLAQLAASGRLVVVQPTMEEVPEAPPEPVLTIPADGPDFPEEAQADPVFPCPVCGKPFPDERRMKGHLGGAHRKK